MHKSQTLLQDSWETDADLHRTLGNIGGVNAAGDDRERRQWGSGTPRLGGPVNKSFAF